MKWSNPTGQPRVVSRRLMTHRDEVQINPKNHRSPQHQGAADSPAVKLELLLSRCCSLCSRVSITTGNQRDCSQNSSLSSMDTGQYFPKKPAQIPFFWKSLLSSGRRGEAFLYIQDSRSEQKSPSGAPQLRLPVLYTQVMCHKGGEQWVQKVFLSFLPCNASVSTDEHLFNKTYQLPTTTYELLPFFFSLKVCWVLRSRSGWQPLLEIHTRPKGSDPPLSLWTSGHRWSRELGDSHRLGMQQNPL